MEINNNLPDITESQEKALTLFDGEYNCSQSVFAALVAGEELNEDEALKIATAFGGGMAKRQQTCGAVTGALMAMGYFKGKGLNDDVERKNQTYDLANKFFVEFEKLHGSTRCIDLLDGLSMNDQNDYLKLLEKGYFKMNCRHYVKDAVALSQKLIQGEK